MSRRYSVSVILWAVICVLLGVTGSAQKGKGKGKGGVDHTATQVRPIQLGTSGGNALDLANGFCCSGTLGALVTNGTQQFILSNAHVLAGDIVSGDNGYTAQSGDPVNQAGLIDVNCQNNVQDHVANLTAWAPLNGLDNVDAAIAQVIAGKVSTTGEILEVGAISSATVAASVNQRVKKSGRTSGLTRSSVVGLNATASIVYSNECAGTGFVKVFTGQIVIRNRGSRFIRGGDSGALVVEDVGTNPRAVGLLYAGSSIVAIANPIDEVLNTLGVTMVGVASATTAGEPVDAAQARGLAHAKEVQERHGRELLEVPGAVGHAIGMGNSPLIQILVEQITPEAQARAPRELEGVPVVLEEVGQLRAMPACAKKK
jgi:hypothetical protein